MPLPNFNVPSNAMVTEIASEQDLIELILEERTSEDEENAEQAKMTKWSLGEEGSYYPSYPNVPQLPSGVYQAKYNPQRGQYYMKNLNIQYDELFELPNPVLESILTDIRKFWKSKHLYEKNNFIHKRGILMYGPPGCGKSSLIALLINQIVKEEKGIVINVPDEDSANCFITLFTEQFRQIEKDRPVLVLLEDIESIVSDTYIASKILNLFDGIKQLDNVVYLATTNYPEKLEERILNRPSRFDRRYLFGVPNPETREFYIRKKITNLIAEDPETKVLSDKEIAKWVKDTEGLSLSHIKELFISYFIMDTPYEEVIKHLKDLGNLPSSSQFRTSGKKVGF